MNASLCNVPKKCPLTTFVRVYVRVTVCVSVCVWFVQSEPIHNILHSMPLQDGPNAEHYIAASNLLIVPYTTVSYHGTSVSLHTALMMAAGREPAVGRRPD